MTSSGDKISRATWFLERIRDAIPSDICVELQRTADCEDSLFAEETRIVANAVAKRRWEFATGRALLRRALATSGLAPRPILRDPYGAPLAPPGYAVSISHADPFCIAAAAPLTVIAAIGVDIERAQPFGLPWALDLIFTEDECHQLSLPGASSAADLGILFFSVKESVFKYVYNRTGVCLAPHNISIYSMYGAHGFTAAIRIQEHWHPLQANISVITFEQHVATFVWSSS